ncbi:hypothetical protein D3C78_589520 [compost metagenome]
MRLLEVLQGLSRPVHLIVLAVVLDPLLCPQAFHQLDLFLHLLVTRFLGADRAFSVRVFFTEASDQVDVDTALGKLVEGGKHPRLRHRMDDAGLHSDQCFEFCRTRDQERGSDPSVPAVWGDRHQHIIETGVFSRPPHPLKMLHRLRNTFARITERRGVTKCRDEPTKLQFFIVIHDVCSRTNERCDALNQTLDNGGNEYVTFMVCTI